MSDTITVRKNWKKKIEALCEGVVSVTSYTLYNGFKGNEIDITQLILVDMVKGCAGNGSKLTYDKETGTCILRHHSNHWVSWINKIEW